MRIMRLDNETIIRLFFCLLKHSKNIKGAPPENERMENVKRDTGDPFGSPEPFSTFLPPQPGPPQLCALGGGWSSLWITATRVPCLCLPMGSPDGRCQQ